MKKKKTIANMKFSLCKWINVDWAS